MPSGLFYSKSSSQPQTIWPKSEPTLQAAPQDLTVSKHPLTPETVTPPYVLDGSSNVVPDLTTKGYGAISRVPIGKKPFCMFISKNIYARGTTYISPQYITLAGTLAHVTRGYDNSILNPLTNQPVTDIVVCQPIWGKPLDSHTSKSQKSNRQDKSTSSSQSHSGSITARLKKLFERFNNKPEERDTTPSSETLQELRVAIVKFKDFKLFWKKKSITERLLNNLLPIAGLLIVAGSITYALQATIAVQLIYHLLMFVTAIAIFYHRSDVSKKIMLDAWTMAERFPNEEGCHDDPYKHLKNRRPLYLFLACISMFTVLNFLTDLSFLAVIPTAYFVNPFIEILTTALFFIIVSLYTEYGYTKWSQTKLLSLDPDTMKKEQEAMIDAQKTCLEANQDTIAASIIAQQMNKASDLSVMVDGRQVARTVVYKPVHMKPYLGYREPSSSPPPPPEKHATSAKQNHTDHRGEGDRQKAPDVTINTSL